MSELNADKADGMKRSVLDSHALLALLLAEPGGKVVRQLLEEAEHNERKLFCCWVNLTEVYYTIARRMGQRQASEALYMLEQLPLEFVSAEREISLCAAEVKWRHPIALGDAFAVGTALSLGAEVVSGDPEFARVEDLVPVVRLARR